MDIPEVANRFRIDLLRWANDHYREFPWRDPNASLYEVFMSEMFLRRTRSDVVESFIPEFFAEYPDLQSIREAHRDALADVIRPMGLQNKRAKGLINLAEQIEGDEIPRTREQLLQLPQVGPYVANATLCFALDRQLPIVDRNVDRIYRRVFGGTWTALNESTRYEFAGEVLPHGKARKFNLALLDFAAKVCTAPEPNCSHCFANEYCTYYAQHKEPQP